MKKRAKKSKRVVKAKPSPKPIHLTINVNGPGPVDIGGGLPIDTLTIGKGSPPTGAASTAPSVVAFTHSGGTVYIKPSVRFAPYATSDRGFRTMLLSYLDEFHDRLSKLESRKLAERQV